MIPINNPIIKLIDLNNDLFPYHSYFNFDLKIHMIEIRYLLYILREISLYNKLFCKIIIID